MSEKNQLEQWKKELDRDIILRDRIHFELDDLNKKLSALETERNNVEKAQALVQLVAQETQQQLRYELSELATLAMESIFPNPQKIDIEFDLKRGKTECVISFIDPVSGDKINPIDESSGGSVDVAALALQISLWSLQRDKTRNVFILDEPLKFLKGDGLPEKGAAMIKEISEQLGIQVIMVSHSTELIDSADRVFEVTQNKLGVSQIKMIKE